ncbi:MAG: hypothetical protein EOP48_34045, partial [Sphingobacteriales bacterium]
MRHPNRRVLLISHIIQHPFGMMMPGRKYISGSGSYRYGFNGQGKENETHDEGNEYDFGERIYSPRIGRFLSVDDMTHQYPWYTPYQFAGNKPIWAIDLDGREEYIKTYKYEDGKATQLAVVKNSYIVTKTWDVVVNKHKVTYKSETVYDKRTGKAMNPAEIGQVQHHYQDKDGTTLNIRRNYAGDFVEGANEMMPVGDNNMLGSIYIGPTNPTVVVNGKEIPDYRREPQDEVDAAALKHDKDYDAVKAAGFKGAFIDKKTIPADINLVIAAETVKEKAKSSGNDVVTSKPISKQTEARAKKVSLLFRLILSK